MIERISVRVSDKATETNEVVLLTFVREDGGALPCYTSGSHIDVHLPNGVTRQYSLFQAPARRGSYRIAVKRELQSRGGSRFIHDELRIGDLIEISMPRNNFPLDESRGQTVLLAGGIGITPLLSMTYRLDELGRSFKLHYFSRSPELTAFRAEMSAMPFRERISFHFALAPDEVATAFQKILSCPDPDSSVYICGPAPFIVAAVTTAQQQSWPADAVHMEYFTADPLRQTADNHGFEVHLARSGLTFVVPPDKSIVEVLTEHGVPLEVSCEQGICGTCVTPVIEGVPQHEDQYLSEEERRQNKVMTICVSRCKGDRLVLDK